ncbi:DMT family transporter [Pirellulaceae bacterium SH501]
MVHSVLVSQRFCGRYMVFKTSGLVFAIASALAFAVMGYWAKHLSRELPSTEIVFFRGLLGAIILLPWCWNEFGHFRNPASKYLILRGVAGAGSGVCYFATIAKTTVANARAIADVAPIFVVILGWRFLGERPTSKQLGYVFLGLLGTSLLGVPGASSCPTDAWLIGLMGALFASLAYFSLRQVSQIFPMSLTVFLFMAALAATALCFWNSSWVFPTDTQCWYLLGIGVTGVLAQLWMTAAYARLPAFLATSLGLSSLPIIASIEWIFDRDRPEPFELLAYALVLCSVMLHAYSTWKPTPAAVASAE